MLSPLIKCEKIGLTSRLTSKGCSDMKWQKRVLFILHHPQLLSLDSFGSNMNERPERDDHSLAVSSDGSDKESRKRFYVCYVSCEPCTFFSLPFLHDIPSCLLKREENTRKPRGLVRLCRLKNEIEPTQVLRRQRVHFVFYEKSGATDDPRMHIWDLSTAGDHVALILLLSF